MTDESDLVITDARRPGRDGTVDITVREGAIDSVAAAGERADGDRLAEFDDGRRVDADGGLVSPGFVDCHMHLDIAYAAENADGDWNERPRSVDQFHELMDDHFSNEGVAGLAENAERAIRAAVANGTTAIRTHAMVDLSVGADAMRAVLRAREATAHLADVDVVPYASRGILSDGAEANVREALELGLESMDRDRLLLGGMDPANRNRDVERTLDRWFDLAREYDLDLDVHLQDGGTLGAYTIERVLDRVENSDFEGRVTASHGFCLGDIPEWRAEALAERMTAVGMPLITCYSSTPHEMPLRTLRETGLTIGHGTDNTHDFGFPHGAPDPLLGALVETFTLHGSPVHDEDYRWYETDQGLELLWTLLTEGGASALGRTDYGIVKGTPADLVVFDRPTVPAVIQRQATRRAVIKNGRVVARDGEVVSGQ